MRTRLEQARHLKRIVRARQVEREIRRDFRAYLKNAQAVR